MNSAHFHSNDKRPTIRKAACLALLASTIQAHAGEGYKLRQPPVGAFGGEIAAQADNPGWFATIALSHATVERVADEHGDDLQVAARTVPLPTGPYTLDRVANGSYSLAVPAGTIAFHQSQTQINLMAGYMSGASYADGRIAFAVNVPLIRQSRSFFALQPAGSVSPQPAAALPAPLRGVLAALGAGANAQVQAGVAAQNASQNAEVSGIGDTELSLLWIRQRERLKVAAGVSLFVPTGVYDKARGPNPGFGNYFTLRPGVAASYALNPRQSDAGWDAGVTVAGRVSFGINTTNQDTGYHSGNYLYTEAAVTKVSGNLGFGLNLLSIRQVRDDTGQNVPSGGGRYRNVGFGPFISYKLPGRDAGFNLQLGHNVASRNALVANTVQLRFIQAW